MRREEYDKVFAEYRAARERWKGLAIQEEVFGEAASARWGPSSSTDGGYTLSICGDMDLVSSADLRRIADLKDDLARWGRNEGPWPLSKTPPVVTP